MFGPLLAALIGSVILLLIVRPRPVQGSHTKAAACQGPGAAQHALHIPQCPRRN